MMRIPFAPTAACLIALAISVAAPASTQTLGQACSTPNRIMMAADGSQTLICRLANGSYLWSTTSSGGGAGPLTLNPDGTACSATTANQVRFNAGSSKLQYCNGSSWTDISIGGGSSGGGGGYNKKVYTQSALWKHPSPGTPINVMLTLVGGGGGGGTAWFSYYRADNMGPQYVGTYVQAGSGGGGGGSGRIITMMTDVTADQQIIIGGGGAAPICTGVTTGTWVSGSGGGGYSMSYTGTVGTDGGSTSFGSIVAEGGKAGHDTLVVGGSGGGAGGFGGGGGGGFGSNGGAGLDYSGGGGGAASCDYLPWMGCVYIPGSAGSSANPIGNVPTNGGTNIAGLPNGGTTPFTYGGTGGKGGNTAPALPTLGGLGSGGEGCTLNGAMGGTLSGGSGGRPGVAIVEWNN